MDYFMLTIFVFFCIGLLIFFIWLIIGFSMQFDVRDECWNGWGYGTFRDFKNEFEKYDKWEASIINGWFYDEHYSGKYSINTTFRFNYKGMILNPYDFILVKIYCRKKHNEMIGIKKKRNKKPTVKW